MPQETNNEDSGQNYDKFLKTTTSNTSATPVVSVVSEPEKPVTSEKFSIVSYLKNAYKELKKVTWPTRQEATRSTGIVILFSVLVAGFLGALDYAFTAGLDYILSIQS